MLLCYVHFVRRSGLFITHHGSLQQRSGFGEFARFASASEVSPYLLTPASKCGSKQVIYDPSHCLVERQWAGYFFHLNPLPPFNVSVVYSGRPLGPHGDLASFEVHHVHVPSMDTQWSSLVSLFKSMNHHSPSDLCGLRSGDPFSFGRGCSFPWVLQVSNFIPIPVRS